MSSPSPDNVFTCPPSALSSRTPSGVTAFPTRTTSVRTGGVAGGVAEQCGSSSSLPAAIRRRSSILGIVRRQSRSMAGGSGIPFEDQINAITCSGSGADRAQSMLNVCASAAIRSVQTQAQNAEEDEEDHENKVNELVDDLCGEVKRQKMELDEEQKEQIEQAVKELKKGHVKELLPARVKNIRDYTKHLLEETEEWKRLLDQHKTEYSEARLEKKSIVSGHKRLRDTSEISAEDMAVIDAIPDGCQMMRDLLRKEKELRLKESQVFLDIGRLKKNLEKTESVIENHVNRLQHLRNSLNEREVKTKKLDFEPELQHWDMEVQK